MKETEEPQEEDADSKDNGLQVRTNSVTHPAEWNKFKRVLLEKKVKLTPELRAKTKSSHNDMFAMFVQSGCCTTELELRVARSIKKEKKQARQLGLKKKQWFLDLYKKEDESKEQKEARIDKVNKMIKDLENKGHYEPDPNCPNDTEERYYWAFTEATVTRSEA